MKYHQDISYENWAATSKKSVKDYLITAKNHEISSGKYAAKPDTFHKDISHNGKKA
jgi:hypothetical protein